MSKEFIAERIDIAHDLIDQGEYEQAVNVLKNIKLRIHDNSLEKTIKEFETKYDNELKKKINTLNQAYKDAITEVGEEAGIAESYAKAYINFYDKLSKEHEIY